MNDVVVHGLFQLGCLDEISAKQLHSLTVCLCGEHCEGLVGFRHHIEVVRDLSVATHPEAA